MELGARTYMSPRRVLSTGEAHCVEGALLAAAACAYHGARPLLLDFQAAYDDEDHVVALFRQNRHWGAISKTNHPGLRYRDAIHPSAHCLAASYFHEYYLWDGRKSLRSFSKPFDLSRYAPESWITADQDLDWLVHALDASTHVPIVPKGNLPGLRPATAFEIGRARRSNGSRTAAGIPTACGKIPGRPPAAEIGLTGRAIGRTGIRLRAGLMRRRDRRLRNGLSHAQRNAEGVGERSEARTQAAVGPPVARRGMSPPSVPSVRPTCGRTSGCSNLGLADALYSRSTRFHLPRPRRDRPCDEIGSVEEVLDTCAEDFQATN